MGREIVSPQQVDLESPGRRDYWIALGHTSVWSSHLIPLTVIVGPQAKAGEGLVAFGANHGNEYEGPVAIKHLLREIRTEDVMGRIILVPVLNTAAFRVGHRESTGDDGFNLNRVFVEGAGTTPTMAGITHRIVNFVRTVIWPHVHISIDLHSGGEVARFIHWAVWYEHDDPQINTRGQQMARWFGTRVVMHSEAAAPGGIAGALFQDATNLGKLAIATELGHGSAVDVRGVRYARHGVLAAAIHNGQLHGSIEPIDHPILSKQLGLGDGSLPGALRTTIRLWRNSSAGHNGRLVTRFLPPRRRTVRLHCWHRRHRRLASLGSTCRSGTEHPNGSQRRRVT